MKIQFEKREDPAMGDVPSEARPNYCPELYLHDLDGSDKIPESGTATISYEISRDSTTKADGKKSRDITLQISEINFKYGPGDKKKVAKMSTEEDVDKNLADAEKEANYEEEED